MTNTPESGPSSEELGLPPDPKGPIVGANNWKEVHAEGFDFLTNTPIDSPGKQRYLWDLVDQFGAENVATGNAMNPETEFPEGIPGYIGVYARTPESAADAAKAAEYLDEQAYPADPDDSRDHPFYSPQ